MALPNVTGAKCMSCHKRTPVTPETTTCPSCGGILDIEYDYDFIRSSVDKSPLRERTDRTMWRYREFLPVEGSGSYPHLRVGGSPLYEAGSLAAYYSSARKAPKVEIDYTKKKELRKKNGGKPGFVIYHTNYSLMAVPDITGIKRNR